jgi:hypothetical protein
MKKLFIVLMLFSLCGCSRRVVDFTIISSKNIDLARGPSFIKGTKRTSGVDKASIFVIIPTGEPNVKNALDRAIENTKGCVGLVDGVIYYKYYYIPYIYGQSKFIVEGTPLIDPALAAVAGTEVPRYSEIKLDKNYALVENREITEQEFNQLKGNVAGIKAVEIKK